MKEDWREYTIDDVAKIINGYAFKSKDFISSGVPIIKIKSLKDKMLVIDNGDFVDKDFLKLNEKYHIQYDDFVIAMTGSHITLPSSAVGRVAKSRHKEKLLLNQRVGKFKVKDKICDHNFLYYFLTTDYFFQNVGLRAKGAGNQANISNGDIGSIKIHLPPLPTQQKIASILSAYYDLIENNIRRIELLEEQAQLIYEEWFVRKKFPNYENTQIDAETGLPEGWEKKGLDYLCSKITDGTHDSPKQVNHGCYLVTGKHLNKGIIDFESAYQISIEDHEKIRKRSGIEKGDILFSNIGTLGNIGVVTEDFEYSCKNVVIFKKKNCFDSFLYCYLTNPINKIKLDNQSSGVAQKFYSLSFIRRFQDFFPQEPLIKKFDEIVQPIFELKYKLHQQNQLLQEARDILLPRLMMGIIEV
ncbi:restriction endonuclease subunit S [Psychrobacter cryohalolentis]|uniref:Restriction modification system DNA specificity domain protein n=1 Tax=Psychrobacter cryohalolentis (strain ATCC BAA-1226 / DSM 17306 / VKM B-2378 / K5) TaxID=335284 RepID=Q1Q862_PSYCK|nr:restriction endonuclease subunit S [Psychrobacter cryohalolentis]ABE76141.1 restriction modification system DNA specificity domain protein [Psychrobacter cryohalolentis K5]ASE26318.1 restriction endonuclease subunit S [Psychrobacter cryohalolentis]|tara:strand:+ start:13014 stop:14255 length:1242 start_codon:yes stop_codon:yes gene_type:complete